MPSLETVLICESSWETPDEQGLLPASKVLDVVGIQRPGSPTLWTYGMKPTGHEEESPLYLPPVQTGLLVIYFERFFAAEPVQYGLRNCLGFAAFMQEWLYKGCTWGSQDIRVTARQVPMTESFPGRAYAFYGSSSPLSAQGMQHAVVGTGVEGDCIGVDSAGGSLVRKPIEFVAQEWSSDTYCRLSPGHR